MGFWKCARASVCASAGLDQRCVLYSYCEVTHVPLGAIFDEYPRNVATPEWLDYVHIGLQFQIGE